MMSRTRAIRLRCETGEGMTVYFEPTGSEHQIARGDYVTVEISDEYGGPAFEVTVLAEGLSISDVFSPEVVVRRSDGTQVLI
jgi:hypothetical protein